MELRIEKFAMQLFTGPMLDPETREPLILPDGEPATWEGYIAALCVGDFLMIMSLDPIVRVLVMRARAAIDYAFLRGTLGVRRHDVL